MRDVFFGLAQQYDTGSLPSVAFARGGTALEVHKNEAGFSLYYRVGTFDKATVRWGPSRQYDNGTVPRCAVNFSNVAVEVHKNELGSTLYYHVGALSGDTVHWGPSREYDSGIDPAVAINDDGVVVEVHKTQSPFNNKLYYHVGRVSGDEVRWGGSYSYDSGSLPQVALNHVGIVVEVHQSQSNNTIWYHVGRVSGETIDFGASYQFGTGTAPSVALNNLGDVIVVWASGVSLMQRVGKVSGSTITWNGDAVAFDDGARPSVAMSDEMAIQVHPSETVKFGLWFSTSILTDRASWMQDRLSTLGDTPLSRLVLPASHDAGMYKDGIAVLGKTQDLSIYGQLGYGIRWFDLRPKWTGSKFVISHGPINGADLSEVLEDTRRFAQEGRRELAILKLSHFDSIDTDTYVELTNQVEAAIGPWLVRSTPGGKRLADVKLKEYVQNGPALLVVVDGSYATDRPRQGFWIYRDWNSADPAVGDLRVFDIYSNTTDFDDMRADQFAKFEAYDGKCLNNPSVPCDLFLLSWTLTPPTAVWLWAKTADRALGQAMTQLQVPNSRGKIVNMLYVDYVEFARVTDVALLQQAVGAVAATGSSLKGFVVHQSYPRVYYLGKDNHVFQLWRSGSKWHFSDVTATAPGASVAAPASPLAGFAVYNTDPRVYYLGADHHVHQLWWSGREWGYVDVTATAPGASAAASGSPLAGFAVHNTDPRVYYLGTDHHVHQLWWSGSEWGYVDVTATAAGAPAAASGSPLAGFAVHNTDPRVYYLGADHHVHQLWWSGSEWGHVDVTAVAAGAPAAASGSPLTGFAVHNTDPRVYYLGADHHVHELWWSGSEWGHVDVTAAAGGASAAASGSSLTGFAVHNTDPRVYYLGADHHVHELWWSGSEWGHVDVTATAGGAPAAAPGSPLTGFAVDNTDPRVYYLGADNHVYQLSWSGSAWGYVEP